MKRLFSNWLPVGVWMLLIFMISSSPDPYRSLPHEWKEPRETSQQSVKTYQVPVVEELGRRAHLFEYAVLGLLVFRAIQYTVRSRGLAWVVLVTVVICVLYALSDETHQLFVPTRSFQLADLGLDLIGSVFGALLGAIFFKKAPDQKDPGFHLF
jgi:VanZ family protein